MLGSRSNRLPHAGRLLHQLRQLRREHLPAGPVRRASTGLDTAECGPHLRPHLRHCLAGRHLAGGYASEYLAQRDPARGCSVFRRLARSLARLLFIIGAQQRFVWPLAVPLMLIGCFSFYTAMGPCIATLHGSLDSYTRATGSALVPAGHASCRAGPWDRLWPAISATLFATMLYMAGQFALDCAGAAGSSAGIAPAPQASAAGLRYAVMTFAAVPFRRGHAALFRLPARPIRTRGRPMSKHHHDPEILLRACRQWIGAARSPARRPPRTAARWPNWRLTRARSRRPRSSRPAPSRHPPVSDRRRASPTPPTRTVPAFCRIQATLTPTSDSDIKVEVWLPASGLERQAGRHRQWRLGRIDQLLGNGADAGAGLRRRRDRHRPQGHRPDRRMGGRSSREGRRFRLSRHPLDDCHRQGARSRIITATAPSCPCGTAARPAGGRADARGPLPERL